MITRCPQCQNEDLEQTTMGVIGINDNRCYCHKCKWKGKVWHAQTACNECDIAETCAFAYDPYNYDTMPGIDCLAVK